MSEEKTLDKIKKAIEKTGYPLELRISQLLQNAGYHVANNLYYVDKDEGKGREIDLRALKHYGFHGEGMKSVRHCLLLECKKSSGKPWVIFTSPETPYDLDIRGLQYAGAGFPGDFGDLKRFHPFWKPKRRGRSYFVVYNNDSGSTKIYKALTNAVKAAIAAREEGFGTSTTDSCFYYPLVVLDGNLYEAYLNLGEIKVEEVNSVMTSFFYQSQKYKQEKFVVPVITESALSDFLSDMDNLILNARKLVEKGLKT